MAQITSNCFMTEGVSSCATYTIYPPTASDPESTRTATYIPKTKTMTTTATTSSDSTPTPRRTIFSNSYELQSSYRQKTTFDTYPYDPYHTSTSTRNPCTLLSASPYASKACASLYGPTATGSSYYSGSGLYDSPSYIVYSAPNPFAIWKIIVISIVAFCLLLFAVGGIFRLREKSKERRLAAEVAANGEVPRMPEVQPVPSYGPDVGQLDQYGNIRKPTEVVYGQHGNVVQPVERVHLRDEAGNVPPVAAGQWRMPGFR